VAALTVVVLAVGGCTAVQPFPHPSTTTAAAAAARAAVRFGAPDRDLRVVADPDPVQRAIQVSRALFAGAPGVVLAPLGDLASQKLAAAEAARLHVPALLVPAAAVGPAPSDSATTTRTASASRTPTPTPSPSPAASGGPGAGVRSEIVRLGARWLVMYGKVALSVTGVRRVKPADALVPELGPVPARDTIAVVSDPVSDVLAAGTVRAAGATVQPMPPGVGDLNASGEVVTALKRSTGMATMLLGSAFAGRPDLDWSVRAARAGWQYPGGGQRAFDDRLFIALYGAPGTGVLGVLGQQGVPKTVVRARALADDYANLTTKTVVPALEVITTVAAAQAGSDGDYSTELSASVIEPYIDAAAKAGMPVVLDLQPGRSDFLTQAKRYQQLLEKPNVGLALDPEWRLTANEVPLVQIGSVSADEVNRTSAWLADLVTAQGLPPKLFVLHQFRFDMLANRGDIVLDRPQLDTLIHVDGQGTQPAKQDTWNALHQNAPKGIGWGWKNFTKMDRPMLTPKQTIDQVKPMPDLVTYQ